MKKKKRENKKNSKNYSKKKRNSTNIYDKEIRAERKLEQKINEKN